jgi:hypothetical protein
MSQRGRTTTLRKRWEIWMRSEAGESAPPLPMPWVYLFTRYGNSGDGWVATVCIGEKAGHRPARGKRARGTAHDGRGQ